MSETNLSRHISEIVLISFIIFLVFGLSSTMHMNDDGSMSDCPFMGQASLCQMSVFEHIAKFQSIFTITVQKNLIAFLILILTLIFTTIVGYLLFTLAPPKQIVYTTRECHRGVTFNKILLALSDGRLQPKLYA